MKKYKEEKGSITLFVLIALLFFVGLLTTSYIATSNARRSQEESSNQIASIYGKDVNNMNEIYKKIDDKINGNEKPPVPPDFTGGVNPPELISNMTPVAWDGSGWYAVDESDPNWYNYDPVENRWANVILGSERYSLGTGFGDGSEYDMYVWMPRFAYDPTSYNIEYVIGNDEADYIHPAFSKDFQEGFSGAEKHMELKGFWMSKYRASDDSFTGSSPHVPLKQLMLSEYTDWFLDELANNIETQEILTPLLEEKNKMYIQTNADYGALLFMTGYAIGDPNKVELADQDVDYFEDIYSSTLNPWGVYGLGIYGWAQLISAISSTEIHPYNDPELKNYYGLVATIADNINEDIIGSDEKTYRILQGSGYELAINEGEVYLINGGNTLVRGFENCLTGLGMDENFYGTYHQCIIKTE